MRSLLFVVSALTLGVGIGVGPSVLPQRVQDVAHAQAKVQPPKAPPGKGYKPLTPERRAYFQALDRAKHGDRIARAAKNLSLPPAFDVVVKSPMPVWDQGQCGSCYLCSTVRTATDAGVQAGLGKPDDSFKLSMQYGMDSPRSFGGCDGGNGTEVIDWAVQHGWIAEKWLDASGATHNDYPAYEARSGRDRTAPGAKVWVKGWTWGLVSNTGAPSLDEIKAAMFLHGRLNIALDAGGQFGNGTSTITALGSSIDHEINVRAWDDNHDNGDGTRGAFLLENQWNVGWGTNGTRWCSYNASRAIVDWFYVSVGVLPPPPPPPPPGPGPTPGPVTTATLTFADGTTQTLSSNPAAQRTAVSITYSDGTVQPVASKGVQPRPKAKTAAPKKQAQNRQPSLQLPLTAFLKSQCADGSCGVAPAPAMAFVRKR